MSWAAARRDEAHLAFVLLTRLPLGRLRAPVPSTAQAAWAFPLVGLVVGAIGGAVYLAASTFLPAILAAILALATQIATTGALHEDGLADVADGFGGGTSRDRKLEIMRDSRIGSYGVVALILALALIALAMAEAAPSFATFAAIGAISRAAMLLPMAFLPPARADGLGRMAALPPGPRLATGLAIAAIAAVFTLPLFLLAAGLAVMLMQAQAKRQIGGQTGDVLGATQKLAECACWLTAAANFGIS
ncbi:MAG: adenosylcobinamide-GDP ribazoletransferase [Silicimonas sp.]|nr:adenosylcobinamide-GDP ribazoletransferase [Silicimonas sp.]